MLILFLQTCILLVRKLCCTSLKTTKQWSKWSLKGGVLQWDMFPGLTEMLLMGCLMESIWTQKSKSNTLKPRTNSQTYWQREIAHVMSGTIFCVCSILAISASSTASKRCRKEHKKMQVKKESQQYESRWWIWCQDAVQGIRSYLPRLHLKTRWTPNLKVRKYLWAR